MKTLDQAIGCWTTNVDGGLIAKVALIKASVLACKHITLRNNSPRVLLNELELLQKRIDTIRDLARAAHRRCQQIIDTKELEQ